MSALADVLLGPPPQCDECGGFWPYEGSGMSSLRGRSSKPDCHGCYLEYQRRYRTKNREKARQANRDHYANNRDSRRQTAKDRYYRLRGTDQCQSFKQQLSRAGITIDEYNIILEAQNGVCAICECGPTGNFKRLAIDHCHETGKIRGLLCFTCNLAIGQFRDNIEVMRRAIIYLVLHKEN